MARFQTLIRYEKEWTILVEMRNIAALVEKMRYVYAEWEMGKARYVGLSGLSLFKKTELLAMVGNHEGGPAPTATKAALVDFLDGEYHQQKTTERTALQALIAQLEGGEIPTNLVNTMIYTLDMAW